MHASSYLYGAEGDLLQALTSPTDDVILNTNTSDHIKFLAEISFQFSNPTLLCHALQLPQLVLDHITLECQHVGDLCFSSYKLLIEWVSRNGGNAKLSSLKSALRTSGIKDIVMQHIPEDSDVLIRSIFDKHPFPNICSSEFVSTVNEEVTFALKLGGMLICCWRRLGSLMGIPLIRLNEIDVAASSDVSYTPGYSMLLEWQRRNGRDAVLGTVFKALKRVFDHSASHVNHAYWYATEVAQKQVVGMSEPL